MKGQWSPWLWLLWSGYLLVCWLRKAPSFPTSPPQHRLSTRTDWKPLQVCSNVSIAVDCWAIKEATNIISKGSGVTGLTREKTDEENYSCFHKCKIKKWSKCFYEVSCSSTFCVYEAHFYGMYWWECNRYAACKLGDFTSQLGAASEKWQKEF